jgi:hypothetical protein
MTLRIDLTPEDEARLATVARERGMDLADCARELLREHLPPLAPGERTKALFAAWDAEDATDDPEEIEARKREWEEFKENINEARAAAGARIIYP